MHRKPGFSTPKIQKVPAVGAEIPTSHTLPLVSNTLLVNNKKYTP